MNQAFVIEAEEEKGIAVATHWIAKELGIAAVANPDVIVLRYGLLSVEDARKVCELAIGAPFRGNAKVIIVAAGRAYHEAQNALLKLFEEPPQGIYLFFILSSLGGLLPTLRSRVQILGESDTHTTIREEAEVFIRATKEKRSALIKKLTTGSDEDERRENREEAIAIINGVEQAAYAAFKKKESVELAALLQDISVLRGNLYDRSAPVRMILEHLSLVIPKGLV